MPRTKIHSKNLQRAITPKSVGIELWFLYTALLHNVTYLCMKFEVTSFNTFEVMPRTRFGNARTDVRTDRRTDGQGDSNLPPTQTSFVGYNENRLSNSLGKTCSAPGPVSNIAL